jgi:hypothetical protein
MRSIGSVSVLAIAGLLAVAGSASASTLAVDRGGTLRFTAAKGEVNRVDLTDSGGLQTVVTDGGSIVTVGNGCVQVSPHQGACPLPGLTQEVAIDLADGNDFAHAFKFTLGHIAISGGFGADTISTATFSEVAEIRGASGADTITAVDGTSLITGGLGADVIDGGGDGDTIDCGLGLDQYVQYPGDTVSGCEIAVP